MSKMSDTVHKRDFMSVKRTYTLHKEWVTHAGLTALLYKGVITTAYSNVYSTFCVGYVGVPKEHWLYGCKIGDTIPYTTLIERGILPVTEAHKQVAYSNNMYYLMHFLWDVPRGIIVQTKEDYVDWKFPVVEENLWWFTFVKAGVGDTSALDTYLHYACADCELLAQKLASANPYVLYKVNTSL